MAVFTEVPEEEAGALVRPERMTRRITLRVNSVCSVCARECRWRGRAAPEEKSVPVICNRFRM